MTIAVALPFIKLLVTAFAVMTVACIILVVVCDIFNVNAQKPRIVLSVVVMLLFFPELSRRMKELLGYIFG